MKYMHRSGGIEASAPGVTHRGSARRRRTIGLLGSMLVASFGSIAISSPEPAAAAATPCGTPTAGAKVIVSNAATINGTAGNDFICAGAGNNVINGGGGHDVIFGGGGNDTINAGAGDDYVDGGAGTDSINGGTQLDGCFTGERLTACELPKPMRQLRAQVRTMTAPALRDSTPVVISPMSAAIPRFKLCVGLSIGSKICVGIRIEFGYLTVDRDPSGVQLSSPDLVLLRSLARQINDVIEPGSVGSNRLVVIAANLTAVINSLADKGCCGEVYPKLATTYITRSFDTEVLTALPRTVTPPRNEVLLAALVEALPGSIVEGLPMRIELCAVVASDPSIALTATQRRDIGVTCALSLTPRETTVILGGG